MRVEWTGKARADLMRLQSFLHEQDVRAAEGIVRSITLATARLGEHPRIGQAIDRFISRDMRRYIVGDYEVRYEITTKCIRVHRVYHTREDRLQ